jgi:hypothetical protein
MSRAPEPPGESRVSQPIRDYLAGVRERLTRYEWPHGAFTLTGVLIVFIQPSAGVEFYKTAAAMIPTLLLTLAVAGRFYLVDRTAGFRGWDSAFILLEIALGEAAALAVVAGAEPNAGYLALVCGSLASVFTAIAMLALFGVTETESSSKGGESPPD